MPNRHIPTTKIPNQDPLHPSLHPCSAFLPTAKASKNKVAICNPRDRILNPSPDLVREIMTSWGIKCVMLKVKFIRVYT
jgi:hypothetical protein